MVMLLDARGHLKDPNVMDIGSSCEEDWTWETEFGDFDVGAVGMMCDHCYRCGWMGHIANERARLRKGRGKEKKTEASVRRGRRVTRKKRVRSRQERRKRRVNGVRSLWEARP